MSNIKSEILRPITEPEKEKNLPQVRVPFLDLKINSEMKRNELLESIDIVFQHGIFIMGPEVGQFEEEVAKYTNRNFAIGVGSGSDALLLTLMALGIGEGDEVITTSLSWIATANAIRLTGATPVFADIKEDLNIDPESVDKLITSKTKAILPVDYTGRIADMTALTEISKSKSIFLIEDASQAFGAKKNGKTAGSFGNISCISLNSMKVFASIGEAGVILTDDESLYERLKILRYNGMIDKEKCVQPSLNCRLDTVQAAVLLKRLPYVDEIVGKRREIGKFFNKELNKYVKVPWEERNVQNAYYVYTIQTKQRNELLKYLLSSGVEAKIRDPILMPEQEAYSEFASDQYPLAKKLVNDLLCLPCNETMNLSQSKYVVDKVKEFFNN